MQNQGFTYAPLPTLFYQGVTEGGVDEEFEFGGKLDQFFILDSTKAGLWEGGAVNMHVESRFGQDVNTQAVGLSPVNAAMLYPKINEHDTAITGLQFSQALSEEVVLFAGKINALDNFATLYPQTGRGVSGFQNVAMVIPIAAARTCPLAFLGTGAMKLKDKKVQGSFSVYDTNNIPTTSGFDELGDNGAFIQGFWRFFTEFGGMPGSHGFCGTYGTGDFTTFDQTGFVFVPGQGILAPREEGTYSILYFYEQTLWMDCCDPTRNIGLLSQWGVADEDTSPIGWSGNIAVQAKGWNCRRPKDAFGVGYFHTELTDDFKTLIAPLTPLQDLDGVEVYYTAAVSKLLVTGSLQVIEPAEIANDTCVVAGVRLSLGM